MTKTRRIVLLAFVLALVSAPAFAQGASSASSLAGTVVDKDGGVVPGVTVVAKNDATGVLQNTTTNSSGVYSFPTMDPGTYTVTISLQGFKKVEMKGVRLLSGNPGNAGKTILEIGALSETIEVRGSTDVIRTQSPTVTSTISTEFISSLPRSDRNALSFLIFLPGVQTNGGAQNSRTSTIAGLPQNTINITIDGINTGNNLQSGDGFFTLVTPRLDSVEEVSLSTSAAGADSSGQGSVQVRFVTRSGTNQFNTSIYDYFQHKSLNSNAFFNQVAGLPRPRRTIQQYGGRVGGPIVIPGLFDGHGKAFFFFNQEEIWQPNQTARARTIIRQSALNGDFTYNNASPTTVNLFALAAASGNSLIIAANNPDPTITTLLGKIRAVSATTGTVQQSATAPNTETFNYQVAVASRRHSPTGRVDLNLTQKHRLSGTYYWQRLLDTPDTLNTADPSFPGFPIQAGQTSFRTTGSASLRSTFGSNLVNEVLTGWQSSPVGFFDDASIDMFSDPRANMDGYAISLGFGLTNAMPLFLDASGPGRGPERRNGVNWNTTESLNWLKGDHSLKFGMEFTRLNNWLTDWMLAPNATMGLSTAALADPALSLFNATNFPTSTTTDLNNARAQYGLLTGRVSSLPGTGFLDPTGTKYAFNGETTDREHQDEYGFYASDSWRWKPNVTITAGLRYELQMPVVADVGLLTGSQLADVCGISGTGTGPGGRTCNLFKPGTLGNPAFTTAKFAPLSEGGRGYKIDTNNFGPNIGINWRPVVQSGVLRKILGDPEQATVSGGYTRTFNRERFDRFRTVYVGNPGATTPATRGFANTNFALCDPADPLGCPVLFSQKSRLTQPAFLQAPTFPLTALASQSIFVFDENIKTPYTDSWTVGLQRSVSRDMAVEARYIGNVNKDPWTSENWNGANYRETGLLGTNSVDGVANQFAIAQANIQANIAGGFGSTFAFTGAPGTAPLPLFLAHFQGLTPANASNPANYTSTQFTNTTWVNALNPFNPNPQSIATNLWTGVDAGGVSWKSRAIDSGIYPANFWVLNPAVNQANVTRNLGSSRYNALQFDLRRRFSKGLAAQASYTYARGVQFSNVDLHLGLLEQRNAGTIPHAIKMLWTWDLPVGRGRRFGTNMNKWVDGALGGWQFSGNGRIQVPLFRLQNTLLVGMTQSEAQDLFKSIRIDTVGTTTVWSMPKDIVDNTIKAYSTNAGTAGFYSAGAPTGRYFAPASRPAGVYSGEFAGACTGLFSGDCAPDMFFYGKWFGEFDVKLLKKFQLPGRAVFEFDVEVFNVFKGVNFNQNLNPGSGSTIFQTTAAGSNARTGQLVWRVTW